MIALLAMEAAGKDATGAQIAAQVRRVTDPKGTPITADAAGFKKAAAVLKDGGSVMYQGATGNVQFDANGDVSAPAVSWTFTEDRHPGTAILLAGGSRQAAGVVEVTNVQAGRLRTARLHS